MKKIIFLTLLCAYALTSNAQTNLASVISSGKIVMLPGFAKYILPKLNNDVAAARGVDNVIMHPKSFTLPEEMSAEDMIVAFPVRSIEIKDRESLMQNLTNGNFKNVSLKKGTANLFFVSYNHGSYAEGYVINVFFSPAKNSWAVQAHEVHDGARWKAGAQLFTY